MPSSGPSSGPVWPMLSHSKRCRDQQKRKRCEETRKKRKCQNILHQVNSRSSSQENYQSRKLSNLWNCEQDLPPLWTYVHVDYLIRSFQAKSQVSTNFGSYFRMLHSHISQFWTKCLKSDVQWIFPYQSNYGAAFFRIGKWLVTIALIKD